MNLKYEDFKKLKEEEDFITKKGVNLCTKIKQEINKNNIKNLKSIL